MPLQACAVCHGGLVSLTETMCPYRRVRCAVCHGGLVSLTETMCSYRRVLCVMVDCVSD